jgi:hypothetical protein
MKASELVKQEKPIKEIYENIEFANKNGQFKTMIPHYQYVTDRTKMELINNGFKVSVGEWDAIMQNALIIEW